MEPSFSSLGKDKVEHLFLIFSPHRKHRAPAERTKKQVTWAEIRVVDWLKQAINRERHLGIPVGWTIRNDVMVRESKEQMKNFFLAVIPTDRQNLIAILAPLTGRLTVAARGNGYHGNG